MNRYRIKGTFVSYRPCDAISAALNVCAAGDACIGHEVFSTIDVTIDASSRDGAVYRAIAPYAHEEASWLYGQPEITRLSSETPVMMAGYWTTANSGEKQRLRNGLM